MDETARQARNVQRLTELYPSFAARIASIISQLEAAGFRPRIQDAWRSPEQQLEAYRKGNSKLRFGFHNVTGAGGKPEALAVDLLDDDFPLNPRKEYLLRLAAAAAKVKCITGIAWGLPIALQSAVLTAVETRHWTAQVKVGWDPTHVEPADVTVQEAALGVRPPDLSSRKRPIRRRRKRATRTKRK